MYCNYLCLNPKEQGLEITVLATTDATTGNHNRLYFSLHFSFAKDLLPIGHMKIIFNVALHAFVVSVDTAVSKLIPHFAKSH